MPFSKMMFLMLLTESFDTKKWSIWVMWFSSVMLGLKVILFSLVLFVSNESFLCFFAGLGFPVSFCGLSGWLKNIRCNLRTGTVGFWSEI